MIEIAEFSPNEIDEAIEGLDGLQSIIAPFLRSVNKDGMGEQDVQQFVRHLTIAKHALIAMGNFLEGQMTPNTLLTLEDLKGMSGEAVWVVTERLKEWCIVHSHHSADVGGGGIIMTRRTAEKRTYPYTDYGKTWLAYRRKPEEGPT